MNQELIDLVRGELSSTEERDLRARIAREPALARELKELESLFGLMRRGEEIEAPGSTRVRVLRAARRATAPSLLKQVASIPALVRYRFQQSVAFRVAAISLCAHLIVMGVLFQLSVPKGGPESASELHVIKTPPRVNPKSDVVRRLTMRRMPHQARLASVGVEGQGETIRTGIESILASQARDGSFGDARETAYAALVLLAEGDCSAMWTSRAEQIDLAIRRIMRDVREGEIHGAQLTALVEDYVLSHSMLSEPERNEYVVLITRLIDRVGDDEEAHEGLALAGMAGFHVPAGRNLGVAAHLPNGRRAGLLVRRPTRVAATVVLARGQESPDRARVRAWVRPLFDRAQEDAEAGESLALAVLTLQSPYRL
ncbi:MAG: hypothetical protein ACYTGV_05295 [Planctomycetota bacterium]|jgi:hypothetical protein